MRLSVLAEVWLLALFILCAGCGSKAYGGEASAVAVTGGGEAWGEVARTYPRRHEVEYSLRREGCELRITIGRLDEGYEVASVGLTTCPGRTYSEKLEGMLLLLDRAKQEGRITNLRRVGPGPVGEMCKGEVRARLLRTTLDRLSDPEFVRQNPRLIRGQGKRLDEKYLFQESDAFREYMEMFQRIGYALEIEEYEGVVFSSVKRNEWPWDYGTLLDDVLVPCNGMVYFRTKPSSGPPPGPRPGAIQSPDRR